MLPQQSISSDHPNANLPQQQPSQHPSQSAIRLLPTTRRRGLLLSQQGWQKLLQAGVICNQFGERYTFEYLSEKTLLDPRTVCRILERNVAVDKRSLLIFFNAFQLELEPDDYTAPVQSKKEPETTVHPAESSRFPLTLVPDPLTEDTTALKQQIIDVCQRFIQLHNFGNGDRITLSIHFFPQTSPQLELHL